MGRKRRIWIGACVGVAVALPLAAAFWRPAPPLAFLDERPMRALYRAEGPTPGPNGQYPSDSVYAVEGSPDELERWLDREASARGLRRLAGTSVWSNAEGTTTLEISQAVPKLLSEPGPAGTRGYLVAREPQPNPPINRLYHWARRAIYESRGVPAPENLPRDFP